MAIEGAPDARLPLLRRSLDWLNRRLFPATAMLALVSLGVGLWAFLRLPSDPPFWQCLYWALQLLVIDFPGAGDLAEPSAQPGNSIPLSLELARFGAALAAATAALQAVFLIFGEQLTRFWIRRFARDHVVVCGLGRGGSLLAHRFHAAGYLVVAIHLAPDAAAVGGCRRRGIRVLIGDASDHLMLRQAGVTRARYLVAVCGADAVNIDVAAATETLLRTAPVSTSAPLTCFVNLDDDELATLVAEAEILAGTRPIAREYFTYAEAGVLPLFDSLLPPAEGTTPHLLVIGLGAVGSRVIVEAARRWGARTTGGDRLRVTVVDLDATGRGGRLTWRHPWLEHVCEFTWVDTDVQSREFTTGEFLGSVHQSHPLSHAFICLGEDILALRTALVLQRRLPTAAMPIVIRTFTEGILGFIDQADQHTFTNVEACNIIDRAAQPQILLGRLTTPRLARAIHEGYRRQRIAEGAEPGADPALAPWETLHPSFQRANLRQARHLGTKLRAIGYDIAPAEQLQPAAADVLTRDELERLAILEHDSWWEDKRAEGFTYGPQRSAEHKTSPYLLPWEQLSEQVKDLDRQAVQLIPHLLAEAGLRMVRPR